MLGFVSNLLRIYCALNYRLSPMIRMQLSKRFPLFYPIDGTPVPISMALLLKDLFQMTAYILVVRQLIVYRATKHTKQGVSLLCVSLLAIVCCFGVFTYTCSCYNLPASDSGRFGVYYLEHLNYLWVASNAIDSLKYVPQLSLNWMGLCTRGLSSKFVFFSLVADSLALIGAATLPNKVEFFMRSYNLIPLPVTLLKFCCLIGLLYQAQYLYTGNKPFLPRGK